MESCDCSPAPVATEINALAFLLFPHASACPETMSTIKAFIQLTAASSIACRRRWPNPCRIPKPKPLGMRLILLLFSMSRALPLRPADRRCQVAAVAPQLCPRLSGYGSGSGFGSASGLAPARLGLKLVQLMRLSLSAARRPSRSALSSSCAGRARRPLCGLSA